MADDLFGGGGGGPAPAAPTPKPPPTMPQATSEDTRLARQRTLAQGEQRRGRQSTVLTTPAGRTLAGGYGDGAKSLG